MHLYNEIKQRQLGNRGKGQRSALVASRLAYTEIVPNYIIYRVHTPLDNKIIRFTLDGKYLICLASSTNTIHLFYTKTCLYPMDVLNEQCCFFHYFGYKYKMPVKTLPGHNLCRNFGLLLDNRKYMILASSMEINPQYASPTTLDQVKAYSDYIFYSIDIESGQTIDQFTLSSDYLFLTQNACVSLHGQMLAILSLKTQEIKLLLIDARGNFHELRSIGDHLRPDDKLTIDRHEEHSGERQAMDDKRQVLEQARIRLHTPPYYRYLHGDTSLGLLPMKRTLEQDDNDDDDEEDSDEDDNESCDDQDPPNFYRTFQQAFFSHLFRTSSQQFYRNYKVYSSMKFWRIQFLDEQTLLINLVPATTPFILLNDPVPTSLPITFFVIVNLATSRIDQVFDQASDQLVKAFKAYASTLHGRPAEGMTWLGSNYSNHPQATSILTRRLALARSETIKRLALDLPILAQSYMDCPYFDLSLFKYDDKLISLTNSKPQTKDIIKFYSSTTHELLFKIDPNSNTDQLNMFRQPSTIIPHPTAPFIITTQYSSIQPPVINFHVYKPPCQK